MYICNNWYVLYVLVDCRRTLRQSVGEENVQNTFQGIDYGAGPEVRPETSIIKRVQQRHVFGGAVFRVSGLEASN
jgi:hypothetical protein